MLDSKKSLNANNAMEKPPRVIPCALRYFAVIG
jgi:hypothetical protein